MLNVSQMRLRWASFSLTKTTCAHIWSRSNMKFKTLQLLPTKWWSCTKKVVFSALDFYSEWNLKNYCRIIWRAIYKLTEVFTTHLFKYKLICWFVGLSVSLCAVVELKSFKQRKRLLCNCKNRPNMVTDPPRVFHSIRFHCSCLAAQRLRRMHEYTKNALVLEKTPSVGRVRSCFYSWQPRFERATRSLATFFRSHSSLCSPTPQSFTTLCLLTLFTGSLTHSAHSLVGWL